MREKKLELIICPNCGAEYLPAEIYLPNSFLGRPLVVEKTILGKIEDYFGTAMDTKESYRCDYCDKRFKVNAKVTFTTSDDYKSNQINYKTILVKDKPVLSED